MSKNFKVLLNQVRAFIFDIDGVLTDNSIILTPDGEQIRTMNVRDGYALQLAVKKGYKVAVISGGKSEVTKKRFARLGIHDVYLGAQNKLEPFDEFILTYGIQPENILYMGDDMPDYEVMKRVAVTTCPQDAVSEIREISIYVSDKKGGEGCVRDVIEQVLKVQGHWE